ncbi:MAG: type IV secretory system conjugative DNA transfer family protein [Dermatophilaceae bacterium]
MTPTDEALVTRGEAAALGLAATITVAVTTVLAGGALSGLVFGRGWAWPPTGQMPSTLGDLVTHPGQPSAAYGPTLGRLLPSPTLFWCTVAALLSLAVIGAGFLAAGVAQRRHQPGMATRRQIRKVARESDAGCAFGTYLGVPVRARGEDSALTIAPARAGKTTRLAVGRVIDAPGAVVATSTKADLVQLTAFARATTGTSHVFDPDRMLAWPTHCRWDIVAGCEDVREAMTRARAMVAARPLNSDRNSSFFEGRQRDRPALPAACGRHRRGLDARGPGLGAGLHRRRAIRDPAQPSRRRCWVVAGPAQVLSGRCAGNRLLDCDEPGADPQGDGR